MRIIVIDGQGGGIGRSLTEKLRAELPEAELVAVGTNSGASVGATGENAVVFNCAHTDVIVGPLGIILADAMLGEITPRMAHAVAASRAKKVLIPAAKQHMTIVGVEDLPLSRYIDEAVACVREFCGRD